MSGISEVDRLLVIRSSSANPGELSMGIYTVGIYTVDPRLIYSETRRVPIEDAKAFREVCMGVWTVNTGQMSRMARYSFMPNSVALAAFLCVREYFLTEWAKADR